MTTKNVTSDKAKTNSNFDLNAILQASSANLTKNVKQGATLYKNEIFEGKTDKEKKAIRVKLRKHLENFVISAKQAEKNKDKIEAIKKDWIAYAKNIYVNIENIVDANAGEQKQKDVKYFLTQMS